MTKNEINNRIMTLSTYKDIEEFVNERLNELEENSEEKTVGQNYTDSFRDYISCKVHYKAVDSLENGECPDLVYDDIMPYINLIKALKEMPFYNERMLFSSLFYVISDYLPNNDIGFERYYTYAFSKEGKVSIKTISKNKVAFCSEKAGMAHNMFKFLGIDSELVCGARNKEMHAYNFIFPNGYGSEPIILYDPSNFVSFIKDNKKISLGFYKALRKEEYELLKTCEVMKIDLTTTERNYRNLYDLNGFEFVNEDSIYVYGFENAKNYVESINR